MVYKKRQEIQKEEAGGRVTLNIEATWLALTF